MQLRSWLSLLLALFGLTGCLVSPVLTRLPSNVATSLQEEPMRRMETDSLLLYYPANRKENAQRIAQRLESCAGILRKQAKIHNSYADQKMVVIVPDMPFNNAFVAPSALGLPHFSVVPTSNTLDFTSELGMPPDPSFVGCHEIAHYVQLLQVGGLWGWMNEWLGNVITPQIGLDAWFLEGLATYYESRLQPGTGRMAWPAWRGYFHAAFAGKRIHGGDLSTFQRPFHWGSQYLVGSHFVDFIAKRYGEAALWKLIERQGNSIFFPFGVALRWKSATQKSLPALVDEFADYVQKIYTVRETPRDQKHVRESGTSARYAVASTGREAIISSSPDSPTKLTIYENDRVLRERTLIDIIPPRVLSVASPILTSGLSFTGDGSELYFVAIDAANIGLETRLLRYRIKSDELEEVLPELGGTGGSVSRDGKSYYYAHSDGDKRHLAILDLASLRSTMIREAGPRSYYGEIRQSPDTSKLVASFFDGKRFAIRVLDAKTGQTLRDIHIAGAVHDPSWIDDTRVLLLAESSGRFQLHVYDIEQNRLQRVSDAPYLAFQARAHKGAFRFLNREGWNWSINSIPNTNLSEVALSPVAEEYQASNEAPLRVHSDKAYSQLDNLFTPSFRTPVIISPLGDSTLYGLTASGSDRLFTHRWSIAGYVEPKSRNLSGSLGYGTSVLAPLEIEAQFSHLAWHRQRTEMDEIGEGDERTQQTASLSFAYPFRSGLSFLSFSGSQDKDPENANSRLHDRRLVGPSLGFAFAALESTPYTGPRRGYGLAASVSYFDNSLSSLSENITYTQGTISLLTPLPLSPRHTLSLGLSAHRLFGLDRDEGFLEVGGTSALYRAVQRDGDAPVENDPTAPSPLFAFQVPLRGFEDLQFNTDRIAIAQLRYRYPLILDMGFSSFAYILPSWFFRQLDLQIFGVGATESLQNYSDRKKLAAGASLDLAMSIWVVPFAIRYQIAQRFTGDEALVHSITIEL